MSHWRIALTAATWMTLVTANAQDRTDQQIRLLDGKPLVESLPSSEIVVSYDGNDDLTIRREDTTLQLSARPPSVLSFSPKKDAVVLNFGDGSGQVYDIAVYNLVSGKQFGIGGFRESLLKYARNRKCPTEAEAVSVVFKRWLSETRIEVSTEDFSRVRGCSALNRSWRINLKHADGSR